MHVTEGMEAADFGEVPSLPGVHSSRVEDKGKTIIQSAILFNEGRELGRILRCQELLDSLSKPLKCLGSEIRTALDALRALEVIKGEPVDVAILDIKMPVMGGVELFKRMKSTRPGIELVFLTVHPSKETAFESMKGGTFQYVTKPPDIAELSACVLKVLLRKSNSG